MVLFSFEAGTHVLISLKDGSEIKAEFADTYDSKVFYVISPEISDKIDEFKNKAAAVTIYNKDGLYKAQCEITGLGRRKSRSETVALEALDEFRCEPHRASPRIDTVVLADIYSYAENKDNLYRGGFICKAVSKDLSRDGIFIITDYNLNAPKGTKFTVSFYFFNYTFFIPAKLMWNKKSTSYEYGLLFDFSSLPELQDRLNTAIFKEKLNYS